MPLKCINKKDNRVTTDKRGPAPSTEH